MRRLLLLGLNHATAPLQVREKCAFTPARRDEALRAFKQQFPQAEFAILSTCNRVELYTSRPVHAHPRAEELVDFLCAFHGLDPQQLRPHLYQKLHRDVAQHLFSVAASLDSMVVGETQILGQVREAYDAATLAGSLGTLLHPLFQRAIAAARETHAETAITEGRRSIASIAVDYARRIFDHFRDKTILSIGAGKMSTLVLQHLSALGIGTLVVLNRDLSKAQELATRFGGTAAPLSDLLGQLGHADIVVSGTASPEPIITRPMFEEVMRLRRYRPAFLIDIALPRDIDPAVGQIDNVYLYNIDDLQSVVAATSSTRQAAVDDARKILMRHVEEFIAWHRTREAGPLIEQLYARAHELARQEVVRTANKLPSLTDPDRAQLDELARRIVNKLLNSPVQAIRQGDPTTGASPYLPALAKLFKLEEPPEPDTED
jgi:glutamyl-tRNA reductase